MSVACLLLTGACVLGLLPLTTAGAAAPEWFAMRDDPRAVLLRARQFITSPGIAPEDLAQLDARARELLALNEGWVHVLVQLEWIPDLDEREAWAEAGVELQEYIPNRTWVARIPVGLHGALASVPGVRWVGALRVTDKVEPEILTQQDGLWWMDEDGVCALMVGFHADVDLDWGADLVRAHGGEVVDALFTTRTLLIELPYDALLDLAAEEAVLSVTRALPPLEPNNAGVRARIGADALQSPPYNLSGAGIDLLVYDAGTVDVNHQDFAGRLVKGDSTATNSHSTHVAGTAAGSGVLSSSHGGTDRQWRGVAPGARVISYGFQYDGSGTFLYTNPGDIEADWDAAKNVHGADIGTASLGTNTAANGFPCSYEGNYGNTAQLLDGIVRGSLGEPYIVTWAAGNERTGGGGRCGTTYNTTAPPACAKNPIHVGATNSTPTA